MTYRYLLHAVHFFFFLHLTQCDLTHSHVHIIRLLKLRPRKYRKCKTRHKTMNLSSMSWQLDMILIPFNYRNSSSWSLYGCIATCTYRRIFQHELKIWIQYKTLGLFPSATGYRDLFKHLKSLMSITSPSLSPSYFSLAHRILLFYPHNPCLIDITLQIIRSY